MGSATQAWIPWASILISSNNFLLSCICRPCYSYGFIRCQSLNCIVMLFLGFEKQRRRRVVMGFGLKGVSDSNDFFLILILTFKSDSYDQIFLVLFFIPCGITHVIWCGIKVIFYLAVSYISIFHPSLNVWDYFDIILKG